MKSKNKVEGKHLESFDASFVTSWAFKSCNEKHFVKEKLIPEQKLQWRWSGHRVNATHWNIRSTGRDFLTVLFLCTSCDYVKSWVCWAFLGESFTDLYGLYLCTEFQKNPRRTKENRAIFVWCFVSHETDNEFLQQCVRLLTNTSTVKRAQHCSYIVSSITQSTTQKRLTDFEILLMHWIVLVPNDAAKTITFLRRN